MKTTGKIAWIVFLSLLIIGIVWQYDYHMNYVVNERYPIEKAMGWLQQVDSTNNLEANLVYLRNAYNEIEHLNGNPSWWYPTEYSSFDSIKESLNHTIAEGRALLGTDDQMAIQQFIHNTGEYEVWELIDRLNEASSWMTIHQAWNMFSIEGIASLLLWLSMVVFLIIGFVCWLISFDW